MTKLNPTDVARLHAQGLSNPQIAAQLGVSLSTVRRCATGLGLEGNGNRNFRTEAIMNEIIRRVEQDGRDVILAGPGEAHHLTIDGRQYDVWTAVPNKSARHTFYLQSSKRTVSGPYSYNDDHMRNVDAVLFVCCDDDDQMLSIYDIPVDEVQSTVTMGGEDTHAVYRVLGQSPVGRKRGRPRKTHTPACTENGG